MASGSHVKPESYAFDLIQVHVGRVDQVRAHVGGIASLATKQPSMLLAEELFETGDARFLATLKNVSVLRGTVSVKAPYGNRMIEVPKPFERKLQKPHMMSGFAEKWLNDPRPWARAQLIEYIDSGGIDRPGHRSLVKRLFKGAEAAQDDELIGHFVAAFDRLCKLVPKRQTSWDVTARRYVRGTRLVRFKPRAANAFHFSQRTRIYLQRRVVRYMRGLVTRDPARFRKALLSILKRYDDGQFTTGQQLLEARALMLLLFARSPAISVSYRTIHPNDLSTLEPRVLGRNAWKGHGDEVLAALPGLPSLFIRRHIAKWLERDFPETLTSAPFEVIERLIRSTQPDLRLLGTKMLERAEGLETLRIETWLAFLEGDDAEALLTLTKKMSDLVTPARASLEQCVALARHVAQAPAMLGVEWAETKTIDDKDTLEAALPILDATVDEVRVRALRWLAPILAKEGLGLDAHMRELLDARHADVRQRAFQMMEETPRFKDSIVLWAALSESPHADARAFLLKHLDKRRSSLEASHLSDRCLTHLWATTLLDIHRGSRAKRRAVTQLGDRIAAHPQESKVLMPLMGVALRSVRDAERRSAIASLVRAATLSPEVLEAAETHAHELVIHGPV